MKLASSDCYAFLSKLVFFIIYLVGGCHGEANSLTSTNFQSIVANSELVFINFYAPWCRFSNMLEPIWNEFADKINKEFDARKVIVAKVDADVEKLIASQNGISKFPTLKMYRFGTMVKTEYRGKRDVASFEKFLKDELNSKLTTIESLPDLLELKNDKSSIFGYFANKESPNLKVFTKLATVLKDKCNFVAAIGETFANERSNGDKVTFKAASEKNNYDWNDDSHDKVVNEDYTGQISQYNDLYTWVNSKCTPTVTRITFENAEELTEGGIPFLIIFHKSDDKESIREFEKEVKRQLGNEISTVLPVAADGAMFSHPLHHLGKSLSDLPVIAIDSFKHMYVFPNGKKYTDGDNLRQFVIDLNNGKLHREFHNGPDPVGIEEVKAASPEPVTNSNHLPKVSDKQEKSNKKATSPPESTFVKLAPSRDRYTIRHGDGGEF